MMKLQGGDAWQKWGKSVTYEIFITMLSFKLGDVSKIKQGVCYTFVELSRKPMVVARQNHA